MLICLRSQPAYNMQHRAHNSPFSHSLAPAIGVLQSSWIIGQQINRPINVSRMVSCEFYAAYSMQNESGSISAFILESCIAYEWYASNSFHAIKKYNLHLYTLTISVAYHQIHTLCCRAIYRCERIEYPPVKTGMNRKWWMAEWQCQIHLRN